LEETGFALVCGAEGRKKGERSNFIDRAEFFFRLPQDTWRGLAFFFQGGANQWISVKNPFDGFLSKFGGGSDLEATASPNVAQKA